MTLLGLSNGEDVDDILILHKDTLGQARIKLCDTSSGDEETFTTNPFYTVGQWVHLLVTMNDGGTNGSTANSIKMDPFFTLARLIYPLQSLRLGRNNLLVARLMI